MNHVVADHGAAPVDLNERRPLVSVRDLTVHFSVRASGSLWGGKQLVRAVDGVSFDLWPGETLGLVGESGCGKSTTGQAVLQLIRPTGGSVKFDGMELTDMWVGRPGSRGRWNRQMRQLRRRMQIIFQDPYASLNPRMTVEQIIAEPLQVFGLARGTELRRRVQELMDQVGMDPRYVRRYPHEFSGGQRQRIGIARALALQPDFIVADEPISALDVSIQAQILNLLVQLQRDLNLAYLFIAHDLAAVRYLSSRIAVMYLGHLVELAESRVLYDRPLHPYTQALISAAPIPDPVLERRRQRTVLSGDVPSPLNPPAGCPFHTRCPLREARCVAERPVLREVAPGHHVACHLVPGR